MNGLTLRPSYWASVSGGKDSLYMLKIILDNPHLYPLDGVIHFELEIDFPFVKNVIDYMEKQCKDKGIKFVRIKPTHTWEELYSKYGFPSGRKRWCNSEYKLECNKQLKKFLTEQNAYLIQYIGYCKDEKRRYEKRNDKNEIYPLVDFGIEEKDILQWAKTVPLFNDYYKHLDRCGCMYCPLQSRKSIAYLYAFYPKNYEYMMQKAYETEKIISAKYERKISVWSGNPRYDTLYLDNLIRKNYRKLLGFDIETERSE